MRSTRKEKSPRSLRIRGFLFGAGEMNRTPDLLITNELLYRLSYTGEACDYSQVFRAFERGTASGARLRFANPTSR